MLQQQRILPEPLLTRPAEQDSGIRKSRYESNDRSSSRNFNDAMAANQRQPDRYERDRRDITDARYRHEKENPRRDPESRPNYDSPRLSDSDINTRPARRRTVEDVERNLEKPVTELMSKESVSKAVTDLTEKYSGKELISELKKLQSALVSMTDSAGTSESPQLQFTDGFAELLKSLTQSEGLEDLSAISNDPEAIAALNALMSKIEECGNDLHSELNAEELAELLGEAVSNLVQNENSMQGINTPSETPSVSTNEGSAGGSEVENESDILAALDTVKKLINESSNDSGSQNDAPELLANQAEQLNWLNSLLQNSSTIDGTKPSSTELKEALSNTVSQASASTKTPNGDALISGERLIKELQNTIAQAEGKASDYIADKNIAVNQSTFNQATLALLKNASNSGQNPISANQTASAELESEVNLVNTLLTVESSKKESDGQVGKDMLSSLIGKLESATSGMTGGESKIKSDLVDVQGVQLDKTLQAPKLEQTSQLRNENIIKENILFNKQELASNIQQQVGLMMARNMKSVDIRLDPPELGSMQIKLSVGAEQASVSFVVSSQQAKDALENSLSKLREMLEQQGMQLAEGDVKKDNKNGQSDKDDVEQAALSGIEGDNENAELDDSASTDGIGVQVNSPWQVDYYA